MDNKRAFSPYRFSHREARLPAIGAAIARTTMMLLAALFPAMGAAQTEAGAYNVALLPNELIQKGFEKVVTADSINKHDVDFAVFTGDTKDGSSRCSDEIIGQELLHFFGRLHVPTLYSPGDNEWTDCHRISNGGYDPLERLTFVRKTFFSRNTTQGFDPLPLVRQGKPGGKYSENSRLVHKNVMFVALHVVGSNNNLVVTEKQCHKKSRRTLKDCEAATREFRERNRRDIDWLRQSFAQAGQEGLPAVVVVIQADIYTPHELGGGGYEKDFLPSLDAKNGFTDFFQTLVSETHRYQGQVLLVTGDSHYYKVDKAMLDKDGSITPNFSRVVVFGGDETSWINMHVDPDAPVVFTFKPIILPGVKALR